LRVQGGNGAGKPTLLRVLAGLLDGGRGEVRLRGVPAAAAARAGQVAYLGHLPGLKADRGAVENLEYLCGLLGRREGVEIERALALVGLAGHEAPPARHLSPGP